ncbi:MAG TPA: YegS/Rv2252/BmrU family lipid kinase [Cytophagaceae bacterium]|jgi:diacylglycerol kinase (ATP)|nr:YegS/Rv2252/BmrU family lipid kinase [Cytophagaceae bacterium]
MSQIEKILFIINPVSGGNRRKDMPQLIKANIDPDRLDAFIVMTEFRGHATILAEEALKQGIKRIVAVGGDGTINETARALLHTEASFGIIPSGSGNGLARHLKIPLDTIRALQVLNNAKIVSIDTGNVNGKAFFCTAGVGFDAHIGKVFADKKVRGFRTYISSAFNEFFRYKPSTYKLLIEGTEMEKKAFCITFANASQYGNNAYICPDAAIEDGFLDICIIEPFPLYAAFDMARRLFEKSIFNSKYVSRVRIKQFLLRSDQDMIAHVDGEPHEEGKEILVKVLPGSLKVMVSA